MCFIVIIVLRNYSTVSTVKSFFNYVNRREDIYLILPKFYMAYMTHTGILKPRTLHINLKGQGLAPLIVTHRISFAKL